MTPWKFNIGLRDRIWIETPPHTFKNSAAIPMTSIASTMLAFTAFLAIGVNVHAASSVPMAESVAEKAYGRGASLDQTPGWDAERLPSLSGSDFLSPSESSSRKPPPPPPPPPPPWRMWECVPGVIRDNGVDTFRLEVSVNGPVSNVVLRVWNPTIAQSEAEDITLRDDGLEGDRRGHDFVFTSEPLRYNTRFWSAPAYYNDDTNSAPGVS